MTRLLADSLDVDPAGLVQGLKALWIAGLWLFQAFLLNTCIFTDRRHNGSMGHNSKIPSRNNLYDSMKIIKNKWCWEDIRPHFTMVQISARAPSLVGTEGMCRSGLPWGVQGSHITCTEGAVHVPLLALPRGQPPDKTGVVLLHQLLTAFCATATKSVLTHFWRVNLNISWCHVAGLSPYHEEAVWFQGTAQMTRLPLASSVSWLTPSRWRIELEAGQEKVCSEVSFLKILALHVLVSYIKITESFELEKSSNTIKSNHQRFTLLHCSGYWMSQIHTRFNHIRFSHARH